MNGAPILGVVLAKGNCKNNRRSLDFARDDMVITRFRVPAWCGGL